MWQQLKLKGNRNDYCSKFKNSHMLVLKINANFESVGALMLYHFLLVENN